MYNTHSHVNVFAYHFFIFQCLIRLCFIALLNKQNLSSFHLFTANQIKIINKLNTLQLYQVDQQFNKTIIMGNCYEDTRVVPNGEVENKETAEMNLAPVSQIMNNSMIISQLRNLPPIPKNVLNRMDELGPFLGKSFRDFGKIYQLKNKSVYQGTIKNKLFHGPGRIIFADGTVIQSQFENGQPKNKTRIFKANGDYFSGTIAGDGNAKPTHGIVHEKGISYEGDMVNQRPHGFGKQHTKNYSFVGTFQNGRKINGLFQWNIQNLKTAQSYEGPFINNQFQGQGILINSEGKYIGNFQNGIKSGYGVFTYPNGTIYQGNFRRNKPDGEGKLLDPEGKLLKQGKWLNGKYLLSETQ